MARVPPTTFGTEQSHTDDMARQTLPPIHDDADRETVIEPVDNYMTDAELASAAFMEEVLTIRIERGREKNAAAWSDIGVNGVRQWVKIGVPQQVKRKFVEVLARAQPFSVETQHGTTLEERPQNHLLRNPFSQYPFSVIRDPNPKGYEWLTRILMN